MITFFITSQNNIIAVGSDNELLNDRKNKIQWLFAGADMFEGNLVSGFFVGPRKEMITPWSTNAVEITQNMGIEGIKRIEEFFRVESENPSFDPMLQAYYKNLDQGLFAIEKVPEPVIDIDDIPGYNRKEGLALNNEEIQYLESLSKRLNRKLTDSEVFGFSQVNSEHCRHKIFNGVFHIDGKEMESSLFQLIKRTTKINPNKVVSAYVDNCSFTEGPVVEQFAPGKQDQASFFEIRDIKTVLSLKAETHNFPTTVEPVNGASTGTGGEIRDRIGGGKSAIPLAGTAVYMTAYPRLENDRKWEKKFAERKWLYQTPEQILIKASNGASDFGNKFGQPLICGSLLTFEHQEDGRKWGYDKVVMLAGGVGFGNSNDSVKDVPEKGDQIILLGGDNYRIGMGGGAVSSVSTGEYEHAIELNAVQRANPEMQKRVFNVIRALAESSVNTIVSIHDHGAGGHLNCLSELVEETGGIIYIDKLPVGDPTLSAKEIVGNESQERMGLIVKKKDIDQLRKIAERERAPFYIIGEVTGDHRFAFVDPGKNKKPVDLELTDLFGKPPKTVLEDKTLSFKYDKLSYDPGKFNEYLEQVLQIEAVACKDWLTNKVDRSVTGKIAKQQCAGPLQLPLNNVGVAAIDYRGKKGVATSIGHAPVAGLIDSAAGTVLSIAESLTNLVWAPLEDRIKSVSLSANWMWPSRNPGEDARLYRAVRAASDFAVSLGINIPTGKDSLSMTQKYKDDVVFAPGTVIISASGDVKDICRVVEPVIVNDTKTSLLYIDLSKDRKKTGGSSFAQVISKIGDEVPIVKDPGYFKKTFNIIQDLIMNDLILAGHDISSGGLITTLLEMTFSNTEGGMRVDLSKIGEEDPVKLLLSENPGIIIQVKEVEKVKRILGNEEITYHVIGSPSSDRKLTILHGTNTYNFDIDELRDTWFRTSYILDKKQTISDAALKRFDNYKKFDLSFDFKKFTGRFETYGISPDRRKETGVRSAIIREKGVNGDREMAYAMYLAGMDVKDIHMTDLVSGRENLEDVNMIVFVGGFSNSDVLGSAKGWAGAFRYNEKARIALEKFYKRDDTLSLGVCNGCQLMVELDLVYPGHKQLPRMLINESGKFESAFLNVDIRENHSVMLASLEGYRLGIWVAHGEGKFSLPEDEKNYHIPVKFTNREYPGNPNGSDYSVAAICSDDGRHMAMMPHLERAFLPWQCAYYPADRKDDQVTPWIEAFVNARRWIERME